MNAVALPETAASTHNATPQKIVTTTLKPEQNENLERIQD